ncbi:MAG: hypothetical protein OEV49_14780 [candidate division Zixibacteria bacterium]|nr:hypothetical protein [candidate division Zixibacteria bacterium]MDH3938516.1 hypothetical protein [candidate division Zixibacteria bacterium]MDH4032858.1 hypothetical protein [candidate division Zixibacteria bacterium]
MKQSTSTGGNRPPEKKEKRCIWMTAGVISFKLCPLEYDCELCEFDIVMRKQQSESNPQGPPPP